SAARASTATSTLSLHDALPISDTANTSSTVARTRCGDSKNTTGAGTSHHFCSHLRRAPCLAGGKPAKTKAGFSSEVAPEAINAVDRKSTRLNSSHVKISYAVFC